jgi:hypothetical protein
VNKKKGSDATVDKSEIKNGDSAKIFIVQVAALSWAATQVPEITVAIHSFLKAGFRSAVQVELLFMIGSLHPLQRQPGLRVSGILFLNAISPAIVGETRNSLWNATMVRRRRVRRAFTPRAGRSSSEPRKTRR